MRGKGGEEQPYLIDTSLLPSLWPVLSIVDKIKRPIRNASFCFDVESGSTAISANDDNNVGTAMVWSSSLRCCVELIDVSSLFKNLKKCLSSTDTVVFLSASPTLSLRIFASEFVFISRQFLRRRFVSSISESCMSLFTSITRCASDFDVAYLLELSI